MKRLYGVIGVILCIISPIYTVIANDNNRRPGYVSVQNARGYTRAGLRAMQRRHFAGSNKNNNNVVDAYFKVQKTASANLNSLGNERRREIKGEAVELMTVTPKIRPRKMDDDFESESNAKNNSQRERQMDQYNKPQHISSLQAQPNAIVNPGYRTLRPPRNYQRKHFSRENKPNFVSVNVHKNLISIDTLRALRNHNRRFNDISPEDTSPKRPISSVMVGKTTSIPGASAHGVRSSKVNEAPNDDTLKTVRSNHNEGEYRKRNANSNHYYDTKAKRNTFSETLRKYTVSKDKTINVERKSGKEYARIGIHEDSFETEDNPYAIFYRTHPETFDELLGDYIPMLPFGTVNEHASVFNTNRNHRVAADFTHRVSNMETRSITNAKKVRLPKKVKNFANYRTLQKV